MPLGTCPWLLLAVARSSSPSSGWRWAGEGGLQGFIHWVGSRAATAMIDASYAALVRIHQNRAVLSHSAQSYCSRRRGLCPSRRSQAQPLCLVFEEQVKQNLPRAENRPRSELFSGSYIGRTGGHWERRWRPGHRDALLHRQGLVQDERGRGGRRCGSTGPWL